jgi:hypothetical protein
MKFFRNAILSGVLVSFPAIALAEMPDLGPPPGTVGTVNSGGGTEVIYRTPEVWDNSQKYEPEAISNKYLSFVESGTKVKVVKRATADDFASMLIQVEFLQGAHAGQRWWIHTRDMKFDKPLTVSSKARNLNSARH